MRAPRGWEVTAERSHPPLEEQAEFWKARSEDYRSIGKTFTWAGVGSDVVVKEVEFLENP